MKEKIKQGFKKLISRREFFKKSTKKILPFIGGATFAGMAIKLFEKEEERNEQEEYRQRSSYNCSNACSYSCTSEQKPRSRRLHS